MATKPKHQRAGQHQATSCDFLTDFSYCRSSLLPTSPAGATPDRTFLAFKCCELLTYRFKDNKTHCFCVIVVEDEQRSSRRLDTREVLEGNHIAGLTGLRRDVTISTKNVYGCLAAPAHYCFSVDND
jgi:hypothetical protein